MNEQPELDLTEVDDFVLVDGDLDDCKSHSTRPELFFRLILCALQSPHDPYLILLLCEPTFEVVNSRRLFGLRRHSRIAEKPLPQIGPDECTQARGQVRSPPQTDQAA